jgi:hypothetical protein
MLLGFALALALLQVGVTFAVPLNRADLTNALERLSLDELQTLLQEVHQIQLATQQHQLKNEPPVYRSCKNLPPGSASGHYLIQNSTGFLNSEYCNAGLDITPGWMRVAHLDMKDSSQRCPSGLQMQKGHRRCVRDRETEGCSSVVYPTDGVEYSRICGKIRAIQESHPAGFRPYIQRPILTVEDSYVDGVSLTHGPVGSRKHIWTFATSYSDNSMQCSCSDTHKVPPFVGHDFFCETGSRAETEYEDITFEADPLWDGEGCDSQADCCPFNRPPWFCKELPEPTTDDIEMRVCLNVHPDYGDIFIEAVDIFVQ